MKVRTGNPGQVQHLLGEILEVFACQTEAGVDVSDRCRNSSEIGRHLRREVLGDTNHGVEGFAARTSTNPDGSLNLLERRPELDDSSYADTEAGSHAEAGCLADLGETTEALADLLEGLV